MADTLNTVSIISFVAAGVFFAMATALLFIFKIPSVLGDLSGRTAKKSIERMRKNNEKMANKSSYAGVMSGLPGDTTELLTDEKGTISLDLLTASDSIVGTGNLSFVMLNEVIFIHTEEVI